MASGNNSAHSKKRRPAKSNSVTAAAQDRPTATTPTPTSALRNSVVPK